MQDYIVSRDGLPPIKFTGELIGEANNNFQNGNTANRWTRVEIYRTKGGKYVAQVARMTRWQGESDRYEAMSKPDAPQIIRWLQGDEEKLGSVSQEAVERACKVDESFAAVWVETID